MAATSQSLQTTVSQRERLEKAGSERESLDRAGSQRQSYKGGRCEDLNREVNQPRATGL